MLNSIFFAFEITYESSGEFSDPIVGSYQLKTPVQVLINASDVLRDIYEKR